MYKIEFYEKPDGTSDIWDFLEKLRQKAHTNKDARIQLNRYDCIYSFCKKTVHAYPTILPSILLKIYGNYDREIIVYYTSITKKILSFCSIISGRKRKKLQCPN